MTATIGFLNTIFWGYVLIYGLLAVGVFFTIRLRFQQILHFGEMFRVVVAKDPTGDTEGISPFQALCTSLASRVGTGNIAGVAVALTLGGPGAIFWMWMVALVGMVHGADDPAVGRLCPRRRGDRHAAHAGGARLRTHNQKMTVAAMQTADMKVCANRS